MNIKDWKLVAYDLVAILAEQSISHDEIIGYLFYHSKLSIPEIQDMGFSYIEDIERAIREYKDKKWSF